MKKSRAILLVVLSIVLTVCNLHAQTDIVPSGETMQERMDSIRDGMYRNNMVNPVVEARMGIPQIPALLPPDLNPDDDDEVWDNYESAHDLIEEDYDDCEDFEWEGLCYFTVWGIRIPTLYVSYWAPVHLLEVVERPFQSDFITQDDAEDLREDAIEEMEDSDLWESFIEDKEDFNERSQDNDWAQANPAIPAVNANPLPNYTSERMRGPAPHAKGYRTFEFHLMDSKYDSLWRGYFAHWKWYWWHIVLPHRDPFLSESDEGMVVSRSKEGSNNPRYTMLMIYNFFQLGAQNLATACTEYKKYFARAGTIMGGTPNDIVPQVYDDRNITGADETGLILCLSGMLGRKGPFTNMFNTLYPAQGILAGFFRAPMMAYVTLLNWGRGGWGMPFHLFFEFDAQNPPEDAKRDRFQYLYGDHKVGGDGCWGGPAYLATLTADWGPKTFLQNNGITGFNWGSLTSIASGVKYPKGVAAQWHFLRPCQPPGYDVWFGPEPQIPH